MPNLIEVTLYGTGHYSPASIRGFGWKYQPIASTRQRDNLDSEMQTFLRGYRYERHQELGIRDRHLDLIVFGVKYVSAWAEDGFGFVRVT